jgi:hypothetical protein
MGHHIRHNEKILEISPFRGPTIALTWEFPTIDVHRFASGWHAIKARRPR